MYSDSKEWYLDAHVSPDFRGNEAFWRYLSRGKTKPGKVAGSVQKRVKKDR